MDLKYFDNKIDQSWLEILYPFLESKDMDNIYNTLIKRKSQNINIYPNSDNTFNAFKYCKLKDLKVVILGQDPYHTPGVADGLAFSSGKKDYLPPSLRNIIKEIGLEYKIDNPNSYFKDGNYSLKHWAEQGVLLLNTALTVEESTPSLHIELWKPFIEYTINSISINKTEQPIYLLWGAHAAKYDKWINPKATIYRSVHPSPLSAHNGFFGCNHFSAVNSLISFLTPEYKEIQWLPS
jgi:uracil-DNA glycosylase